MSLTHDIVEPQTNVLGTLGVQGRRRNLLSLMEFRDNGSVALGSMEGMPKYML